ncbi:MAG: hypothetical protein IT370_15045 [Deltaproteobacteria bacterium]|nr:hypothetical protein [Deltaproteobacteria bacterium]
MRIVLIFIAGLALSLSAVGCLKADKTSTRRRSTGSRHARHEHKHRHPHGSGGHHHHPHVHPHIAGQLGHHHPY